MTGVDDETVCTGGSRLFMRSIHNISMTVASSERDILEGAGRESSGGGRLGAICVEDGDKTG